MVANLRRESLSRENVHWSCSCSHPRATATELELLVDATIRAGYPQNPLTLDEAREVLRKPLPPNSVTYLHSARRG